MESFSQTSVCKEEGSIIAIQNGRTLAMRLKKEQALCLEVSVQTPNTAFEIYFFLVLMFLVPTEDFLLNLYN